MLGKTSARKEGWVFDIHIFHDSCAIFMRNFRLGKSQTGSEYVSPRSRAVPKMAYTRSVKLAAKIQDWHEPIVMSDGLGR